MPATPCSIATPARPICSRTTAQETSGCSRAGIPMEENASRVDIPKGVGVAKLTAAGNVVWCNDGPDFIFNTLTVEGPREPLHEFLGAASGPGFIDWRPEWYGVYESIYLHLMRAGMPTVEAAVKLPKKFRAS